MSQENENIQVVVRCRGRNAKETNSKSNVVVHVDHEEGEDVILNPSDEIGVQAQLNSKVYKFNKVYGPMADQESIFKGVASPMFDEFLRGYNCTLLVYGMTSSGKTYTMTGDTTSNGTQLSDEAGIIPRILLKLFEVLNDSDNDGDYIVKCSFVELYNEELKDLLSDDQIKKLRIFDQKQTVPVNNLLARSPQPYKSAIHIQNLEEVILRDAKHGLRTLQKGLKLRQVAATKMNDVSSRSHTIFTLNLFRQNKDNGELFRISKMNMVDLAGSENISRSGALNQRAKEAGSINQSLLTLGRVINLLVDKNETTHIPFRESKLTRLLQDSLGGRTKTCLIATISPAKINYDETLSTLEYANKAKSIQNKPQLGSSLSRDIMLKELVVELTKVKADLSATRSKDGIYMDNVNYEELMNDAQEYKTEIQENIRKQEQLKKQNDFFKGKLANVELQNIEYLTLINTLNTTVETLHNKIDTQKQNEKDLMTSSSKFKNVINTINSNVKSFLDNEHQTKNAIKNLVDNRMNPAVRKIIDFLKVERTADVSKELKDIVEDFQAASRSYQKLINDTCLKVSNSILAKLPILLEDIETKLRAMDKIDAFVTHLNEEYTKLSQENNNLKIMINEKLFNNHQEIVENAISHTYNQLQAEQQGTYAKVLDLLNSSSSKQQELVCKQIKATVRDVVGIEQSNLNPAKNVWDHSSIKILNNLDKENLLFKEKHQKELSEIFSKLKESNDFTSYSKATIEKELKETLNFSQNIDNALYYQTSLKSIESKFEATSSYNTQLIDMLQWTKSTIQSSSELLSNNVIESLGKTDLKVNDYTEIIKEIESEQQEIKQMLLPTGKTPQRQALDIPRSLTTLAAPTDSDLNRSPPKFQLIGQRFDQRNVANMEDKENNVAASLSVKRKTIESNPRPKKVIKPTHNPRARFGKR